MDTYLVALRAVAPIAAACVALFISANLLSAFGNWFAARLDRQLATDIAERVALTTSIDEQLPVAPAPDQLVEVVQAIAERRAELFERLR